MDSCACLPFCGLALLCGGIGWFCFLTVYQFFVYVTDTPVGVKRVGFHGVRPLVRTGSLQPSSTGLGNEQLMMRILSQMAGSQRPRQSLAPFPAGAMPQHRVHAGSSWADTSASEQTNAALVCIHTYINQQIFQYDNIFIIVILILQCHIIKLCCCSSAALQHFNKDHEVPIHNCSLLVGHA